MFYDVERRVWVNRMPNSGPRICRFCGNPVRDPMPGAMNPAACCMARERVAREERIERARREGRLV